MAARSSSKAEENTPDDGDRAERETRGAAKSDSGSNGTRYLNTTSTPLVYDKEGHQVDAHGWTPGINLDAVGKAARQAGHLLPESAV